MVPSSCPSHDKLLKRAFGAASKDAGELITPEISNSMQLLEMPLQRQESREVFGAALELPAGQSQPPPDVQLSNCLALCSLKLP